PGDSEALVHAILQVLLDSMRPYPQRVSGYPHPIGKFFPAIYFGPGLMFVICEYQFPILSRKFLHALFEALVSQIGLFRRVGGWGMRRDGFSPRVLQVNHLSYAVEV